MADLRKRLSSNAIGNFFVDSTCINCDTCRQIAPTTFGEAQGYSMVAQQPSEPGEERAALRALLCCPTGSIGTESKNTASEVVKDFPLSIDGGVYYSGFNSAQSYGGNSYFVQRATGNWLIDSPKYLPHLAARIEKLGGLQHIFLTHRDDVADAKKFAAHFGAKTIIHRRDASALPDADTILEGDDVIDIAGGIKLIPTPGHTAGHCVLLLEDKYLFTGDHMAWEPDEQQLASWPEVAWFDWELQKKSVALLRQFRFEWVLPGHGHRVHLPANDMHKKLEELVARLE